MKRKSNFGELGFCELRLLGFLRSSFLAVAKGRRSPHPPCVLSATLPKPASFDPVFVLHPVGHGGTLKGLGLIQLFVSPSLGPLQVSLA